jgi:hypothetical protein
LIRYTQVRVSFPDVSFPDGGFATTGKETGASGGAYPNASGGNRGLMQRKLEKWRREWARPV